MFFNSLHFKVTVWYALALGGIIFVFGALIYQNFKASLFGNLDNLLQARAENIEDLIESAVKSIEPSSPGYLQAIRSTMQEEQEDSPFVEIFDSRANSLAITNKNMLNIIPAPAINSALLNSNIQIQTFKKVQVQNKTIDLRMLTMPVLRNSRLAYIIQVGGDLSPALSALHRLKTVLYLFLTLALLFAVLIGFFITKMALNPVNKISQTMSRITTQNLQERINVPGLDSEIRLLANTFNGMLARLERSFTVQKQFIQDISHELKTPLTAMRGKQEVSLLKKRSTEEYESVLKVNLDEIEKMSRLVENLLVLISIDNKETFFKMDLVDMPAIVKQTVDNMKVLAQQKQIKLNSSLQKDIFIKGDSTQISRVVTNLLDNAIKYTPMGGRIDIKLYQEKGLAKITVANTGPGIEKDDLPRIFDRFYRADKSRNTSGYGLGLSIAKSIIDAHKGTIEVKSEPHKATIFTISIPLSIPSKD